jgi:hypothetical protein
MKAISLWQPWATLVALKLKTIETRDHDRFKSLIGKRIAIHGAQRVDKEQTIKAIMELARTVLDIQNMLAIVVLNRGRIVCTAMVDKAYWIHDPNPTSRDEYAHRAMCEVTDKYCLFLKDVRLLKQPVAFRGRQGIFEVPDELVKE